MKKILIIIIIFSSCTRKSEPALITKTGNYISTDSSLHFVSGYWYHSTELLSGQVTERDNQGHVISVTKYLSGKEEGWTNKFYPNGQQAEKRYYHLGEKDSVHTGWWANGNKRFEYHFNAGVYNGDYKEWYESGKDYKVIHYVNGAEEWAKGWRENGKLYMNFIVRNGRRYGIENANLCYTVKNEKGEYVENSK